MNRFVLTAVATTVAIFCYALIAVAAPLTEQPTTQASQAAKSDSVLLGLPEEDDPVVVRVSLEIQDIDEINEENETFEFTGVLTLIWSDSRQAFDPAAAGVEEKIYQGDYQFNELSPSWFPQVVLVNSSGSLEQQGVVLRARPDGTQILISKITAVAKTELDLKRFPFDRQRLEAVFEVLGFDHSEVVMQVGQEATANALWVPQWTIKGLSMSTEDRAVSYAGRRGIASMFVASVDVQRVSLYIGRLVILPLIVIVLLTFSVFWMDRASLGDRISVSFIGILTAVAYQVVMNDIMPRIGYVTWIDGFLNLSFLLMVGTVIINLVVGRLDQHSRHDIAHRVDVLCRWAFPITYLGLILISFAVMSLI
jgi:hypothetical protein